MLFVIFTIAFAIFLGIDESFGFGILFIAALAGIIIAGLAHIMTLTTAVYRDAKRKKLGARIIWTIFTFLFGLPAGIFYALFTFKAGKYEERKDNRKNIILVIISIVLMFAFTFGTSAFMTARESYEKTHFSKYMTTYKNSDGEDVIYDKMGIAYTREEYDNFKYYDRNGKTYTPVFDYDVFSNIPEINGVQCIETGEEFTEYDYYDFFIDKDGYLVITNDDTFEYSALGVSYDSDKNIYYYLSSVEWSPDGEMVFNTDDNLSKITYQDILDKGKEDKASDLENEIYCFFDFYKDSDWEMIQYRCTKEFMDKHFDGETLCGFKSAQLVETLNEGYYDNNEDKYYVTAKLKCRPAEGTELYDADNKYITLKATVIFEYEVGENSFEEWSVTDIEFNN